MNIRWLRSNGTLLALLAVTMVTVGLLTTLVVRQQHGQATETGQVYLERAGGGTAPAVPLIPADPSPAGTGDRGVDSAPAPQPVDTDRAPAEPSSNGVTHSNGSAQLETVAPSRISGRSDSAAAGSEKPADAGPPRDAVKPKPPDQVMPPRMPSQPREPARSSKPVEADGPGQRREPTEPGKTTDHDKPGKTPDDGKPGKAPGEGKPGKPDKPGKPGDVDSESGQGTQPGESEPHNDGRSGKPTESAQPPADSESDDSHGSNVRTQQTRKPDVLDSTKTPQTKSDADEQTRSESVAGAARTDKG